VGARRDVRDAGVDVLTLGQYLRPTPKHAAVDRYVEPARFDAFAEQGKKMGFAYVAAGPLVRSSYKAAEVFVRSVLRPGDPEAAEALLRERVIDAHAKARSTSEVAAREASTLVSRQGGEGSEEGALLSPASLVRR
jgi:lipoic acid synthetase